MKLIVGLGNPGEKYEKTRHNLGFSVVDKFLKDFSPVKDTTWNKEDKLKSEITLIEYKPKKGKLEKVILAKPQTYMNNSGLAVSKIISFYKIQLNDVLIIYDELDLPLGSMKIRYGGAAAGHHGVESIIENLKSDKFWRMRLGIGSSKHHDQLAKHKMKAVEDLVLSGFGRGETGKARELVKRASKAIFVVLEEGMDRAMNRFNTK